jgi:tRNA modification GTPase
MNKDLICAIANPPGVGAIGIIRLSGIGALDLAKKVTSKSTRYREACFVSLKDEKELLDTGILISFKGPNSFTGEDLVEFQGHGNPVIQRRLINYFCRNGARLANPGEFSERAYLNEKIDLAQAEAISDLITSKSEAAAAAALKSMRGDFSHRVNDLSRSLVEARVNIEVQMDFVEEEVDHLAISTIQKGVEEISQQIRKVIKQANNGDLLNRGIEVVLTGEPNTGKSSIFNALAMEDRAIVTEIPGTTTDALTVDLVMDGLPVRLSDTAGIRAATNRIEALGIEKAIKKIQDPNVVVLLVVAADQIDPTDISARLGELSGRKAILIINKIDLQKNHIPEFPVCTVKTNALTGVGLDRLREALPKISGYDSHSTEFMARTRHVDCLERTERYLEASLGELRGEKNLELIAEDLRYASESLGEICGKYTADDLLGEIFSAFCIGK